MGPCFPLGFSQSESCKLGPLRLLAGGGCTAGSAAAALEGVGNSWDVVMDY